MVPELAKQLATHAKLPTISYIVKFEAFSKLCIFNINNKWKTRKGYNFEEQLDDIILNQGYF